MNLIVANWPKCTKNVWWEHQSIIMYHLVNEFNWICITRFKTPQSKLRSVKTSPYTYMIFVTWSRDRSVVMSACSWMENRPFFVPKYFRRSFTGLSEAEGRGTIHKKSVDNRPSLLLRGYRHFVKAKKIGQK